MPGDDRRMSDTKTVQSVAVLGLGMMGGAMAQRLVDAGLDVRVWNRSPEKAEPFGDRAAASAAEAVEGADAVLTMLFDADSVRSVADDVLPAMTPDAIWIQASTTGPVAAQEFADRAREAGVRFLDAPVLGTKAPAEQGKLTALLAGADADVEAIQPVLDAISVKQVRVGAPPQASALKIAANAWIATLTAGIGQSLTIAERLGVDPADLLSAVEGSAVDTPYLQMKGKAVIGRDFTPSFEVTGLLKDVRLAAETPGVDPTLLDALASLYASAADAGHGDEDIAAVWHAFQR
ncbi:3-hydroxyisobutyrate dehydrogenase [Klenkia soli]|uniref:3-hydroxyisobutyrate dehydrogenase n=2 Tax=Klenkia soli TaxID=1052260 RepID=A0A1H0Q3Y0_9ACTN|nr:3-hydroxyisobutyrate dehydrogenase [Klenkia soli]